MSLKQGVTGEKLDQDASYTPDIARIRPAEAQDNFGSTIVPSRDDGRVIFVLEGRRAEVNETNLGIEEYTSLRGLAVHCSGRGGNLAVIRKRLIIVLAEQDVLWFEVGMDEAEVVEDYIRC